MLKKFLIFTKKNQIKLTYHEKIIFFIMMPSKSSTFTPPILNFCPFWSQNSFGFYCSSYQKKRGGFEKYQTPVFAFNLFLNQGLFHLFMTIFFLNKIFLLQLLLRFRYGQSFTNSAQQINVLYSTEYTGLPLGSAGCRLTAHCAVSLQHACSVSRVFKVYNKVVVVLYSL